MRTWRTARVLVVAAAATETGALAINLKGVIYIISAPGEYNNHVNKPRRADVRTLLAFAPWQQAQQYARCGHA